MVLTADVGSERFTADLDQVHDAAKKEVVEGGTLCGQTSAGAFMSLADWLEDSEMLSGVSGWNVTVDGLSNIEDVDRIVVSLVENTSDTSGIRLSVRHIDASEIMPIESLSWTYGSQDEAELERVADCWVAMTVRVMEEANLILDVLNHHHHGSDRKSNI